MTLSAEIKKQCLDEFNQHSDPFISLPQVWFVLAWLTSAADDLMSSGSSDKVISTNEVMHVLSAARNQIIEDQMIAGRLMRNFKVRKALGFLNGLQDFERKKLREKGIVDFPSKLHACTRIINLASIYFIRVFGDHRMLDSFGQLFDDQHRQLEFKTWGKSRCYDLMRSSYNSFYAIVKIRVTDEKEKQYLLEELEVGWYMFCLKYASLCESVTEVFWKNADLSKPNGLPPW